MAFYGYITWYIHGVMKKNPITYNMLYTMLYSTQLPTIRSWMLHWQAAVRIPTLIPQLLLYSSFRAPSQAPEERDWDWEDYNHEGEPAAACWGRWEQCWESLGCSTGLDPWIQHWRDGGFAEDLPTQDHASRTAGMTVAEAVEVSYILYSWLPSCIALYIT